MLPDKKKIWVMNEMMLKDSTIDDPVTTRTLLEEIEASAPIPAKITPQGIKKLKAQGVSLNFDEATYIEYAVYSGDMDGILCAIPKGLVKGDGTTPKVAIIPITHLQIAPDHPLAEKIYLYQKKRITALAILKKGSRPSGRKWAKKGKGFTP